MKNNYLIESTDYTLIKNEIEKLINKSYKDAYISKYDLEEDEIDNVITDLDTYGLFSEKKVIIVYNILNNPKDEKLNHIINYINNYNPDYLLILVEDKLDSRLNLVKDLKKNKNIEIISLEVDCNKYIKEFLKDYKIDNKSIELLCNLCKNDITRITNECNKLMMYKSDDKIINNKDINLLVVEKLGESNDILFSLVNYIISKDKKNALTMLKELNKYDIDNYSIIGLMASQIRIIHGIKVLDEDGLNNDEIAKTLNVKSVYQIKKLRSYINNYSYQEIHIFIKKLADTDYKMKSGKIEIENAIEMLIINL